MLKVMRKKQQRQIGGIRRDKNKIVIETGMLKKKGNRQIKKTKRRAEIDWRKVKRQNQ